MKHSVKIIFGEEQVNKIYNNENLTEEELAINVKEYFFGTLEEKVAFIRGIDEAVGWTEHYVL